MARKATKTKEASSTRCPADDKSTRKPFVVADGCIIGDNDGAVKCGAYVRGDGDEGDTIMLTKSQAVYWMKKGYVQPAVPDFEEDDNDTTSGEGAAETGGGKEADGGGNGAAGSANAPSSSAPAAKGRL